MQQVKTFFTNIMKIIEGADVESVVLHGKGTPVPLLVQLASIEQKKDCVPACKKFEILQKSG